MTYDLTPFKKWLQNKSYSDPTVRNYLADVNKYLAATSDNDIFSSSSLSAYINQLTPKSYAQRALASLSKFCQYALDQKIITTSPIRDLTRSTDNSSLAFDDLLTDFKSSLSKHHKSESTITNYINDIKQFISYCQEQNPNPTLSLKKGKG